MISKVFLLFVASGILLSCNSSSNVYVSSSRLNSVEEKIEVEPTPVVEDGNCMADTLSFLVGQPDTALSAMEYPENTRIMILGQFVSQEIDSTRLNLVLGSQKEIVFVYCG